MGRRTSTFFATISERKEKPKNPTFFAQEAPPPPVPHAFRYEEVK